MTQTPMGAFLVSQTVEERRLAMKAVSISRIVPDMSALPKLKPRRKLQPGKKKLQ